MKYIKDENCAKFLDDIIKDSLIDIYETSHDFSKSPT